MPSVSQTSVIVFALLVGFVVFITVRGELPVYLWVLGLSDAQPAGTKLTDQIDTAIKGGTALPPILGNPTAPGRPSVSQ
jgi:hypothetical protein